MNARQLTYLLVAALIAFVASDSFFTVEQDQRAVLFELSRVRSPDIAPGLHFKLPFIESVLKLDARTMTLPGQTTNFPTADGRVLEVDYYAEWKISDPVVFYQVTGGQSLAASDHLSAIVNRCIGDSFSTHKAADIEGDGQDRIVEGLLASLKDQSAALGVTVVDVRFKHIDLPQEVAGGVYQRMRAEQNRTAADLRASATEAADKTRAEADGQAEVLLADAYRDSQKIRGEGDAKAAEIYAKAYSQDPEFFRFYRSIDAYRQGFKSGHDVMVLEPDGEFFRYFNDAGGGKTGKR